MDDFEAPSFSLGLDAEVKPISDRNDDALRASNPFRVGLHREPVHFSCKDEKNTQTSTRNSDLEYDSDFELLPLSSTPRIMKRLQRKSGHSVLAPVNNQVQLHHASDSTQNQSSRSNEKGASLPQKSSATGSKGRTLPNFWKGLHCKTKSSSAPSCSQVMAKSGSGVARRMLKETEKLSAKLTEIESGDLQSTKFTTADRVVSGSSQLVQNQQGVFWKENSGQTCEEQHGFTKAWKDVTDDCTFSAKCLSNNNGEGLKNDSPKLGKNVFDISGNNSHDHSVTLCDNPNITTDDYTEGTFRKSPDVAKNTAPNEFSCELHDGGEALDICQRKTNDQTPECPMKTSIGKANVATSSQGKTTALQSFWKSLNEKKVSSCENNGGIEEDDIENSSTDDDFDVGTQSARRLSCCGNTGGAKSLSLSRVADYNTPVQGLSQKISKEAFVNPTNSAGFQSLPKNILADEKRNWESTAPHTNPKTSPNFAFCDASKSVLTQNSKYIKEKDSISSKNPPEIMANKFLWRSSDEEKSDPLLFSHSVTKNDEGDVCGMFEARVSSSGDHVSINNPIVANLLRSRFPHFLPVSALRQGEFVGAEQTFIDYRSQFSGSKSSSCGSGSIMLKQQSGARKNSKWRKLARESQKRAMADSDGWIQMGRTLPAASGFKNTQYGRYRKRQRPSYTDAESNAGLAGHWITEKNRKKIYITKDGQKLSGTSAFRQYAKDNKKRLKTTKGKRPRRKKPSKAT